MKKVRRLVGLCFRAMRHPRTYLKAMRHQSHEFLTIWYNWLFIVPRNVRRISRKQTVNVVFLAMNPDMWKYGGIYELLRRDARFNPIIVIATRMNATQEVRLREQALTAAFFEKKGYRAIPGFDVKTGSYIDLKTLNPDLIFHTQPYNHVVADAFDYRRYRNVLHCYAPYGFSLTNVAWNWDNMLQNICWRQFVVGDYQVHLAQTVSRIRGKNTVGVGYCIEEELHQANGNRLGKAAAWRNDPRKHVIWAPHHSIYERELFKVSSFLEIAEEMRQIRKAYADKVIFAFKPHPMLKAKLLALWGEARTEAYYAEWEHSDNSFLSLGAYQLLFAGSDAMIHCSGSFIVEYLYTNKPVQYVYAKNRNPPDLGVIGDAALEAHYPAHGADDIRRFLDQVVLGGNDSLVEERKALADKYLRAPAGELFSNNVYQELKKGLGWNNG